VDNPAGRAGDREYRLPGPETMPATRARVATAKSMFGSGSDFRLTLVSTASATASCPDFGAARRTRPSSTTASRVAAPVHEMAEARYLLTAPQ
jgi:hypothetical protein